MSLDLLGALILFAFVTSITPGPNNIMLMTSGANFGLRRTIPHMLGVGIGFTAMVAAIGLGLNEAIRAIPHSGTALKIASVVYMLWLAWKYATAAPVLPEARVTASPLTFGQAAAFQWVNPKAWAMAVGAIGSYAPDRDTASVLIVAGVFGLVNIPSVGAWAGLGQTLRRFLSSRARLRAFNLTMATLLLASLWPILTASEF